MGAVVADLAGIPQGAHGGWSRPGRLLDSLEPFRDIRAASRKVQAVRWLSVNPAAGVTA
jgi:hypothetical protein